MREDHASDSKQLAPPSIVANNGQAIHLRNLDLVAPEPPQITDEGNQHSLNNSLNHRKDHAIEHGTHSHAHGHGRDPYAHLHEEHPHSAFNLQDAMHSAHIPHHLSVAPIVATADIIRGHGRDGDGIQDQTTAVAASSQPLLSGNERDVAASDPLVLNDDNASVPRALTGEVAVTDHVLATDATLPSGVISAGTVSLVATKETATRESSGTLAVVAAALPTEIAESVQTVESVAPAAGNRSIYHTNDRKEIEEEKEDERVEEDRAEDGECDDISITLSIMQAMESAASGAMMDSPVAGLSRKAVPKENQQQQEQQHQQQQTNEQQGEFRVNKVISDQNGEETKRENEDIGQANHEILSMTTPGVAEGTIDNAATATAAVAALTIVQSAPVAAPKRGKVNAVGFNRKAGGDNAASGKVARAESGLFQGNKSKYVVKPRIEIAPNTGLEHRYSSIYNWTATSVNPRIQTTSFKIAKEIIFRERLLIDITERLNRLDERYWRYCIDRITALENLKSLYIESLVRKRNAMFTIQNELATLFAHLRGASVSIVQYVLKLRKLYDAECSTKSSVSIFWYGENYLLKMREDVNRFYDFQTIRFWLGFVPNPFMLPPEDHNPRRKWHTKKETLYADWHKRYKVNLYGTETPSAAVRRNALPRVRATILVARALVGGGGSSSRRTSSRPSTILGTSAAPAGEGGGGAVSRKSSAIAGNTGLVGSKNASGTATPVDAAGSFSTGGVGEKGGGRGGAGAISAVVAGCGSPPAPLSRQTSIGKLSLQRQASAGRLRTASGELSNRESSTNTTDTDTNPRLASSSKFNPQRSHPSSAAGGTGSSAVHLLVGGDAATSAAMVADASGAINVGASGSFDGSVMNMSDCSLIRFQELRSASAAAGGLMMMSGLKEGGGEVEAGEEYDDGASSPREYEEWEDLRERSWQSWDDMKEYQGPTPRLRSRGGRGAAGAVPGINSVQAKSPRVNALLASASWGVLSAVSGDSSFQPYPQQLLGSNSIGTVRRAGEYMGTAGTMHRGLKSVDSASLASTPTAATWSTAAGTVDTAGMASVQTTGAVVLPPPIITAPLFGQQAAGGTAGGAVVGGVGQDYMGVSGDGGELTPSFAAGPEDSMLTNDLFWADLDQKPTVVEAALGYDEVFPSIYLVPPLAGELSLRCSRLCEVLDREHKMDIDLKREIEECARKKVAADALLAESCLSRMEEGGALWSESLCEKDRLKSRQERGYLTESRQEKADREAKRRAEIRSGGSTVAATATASAAAASSVEAERADGGAGSAAGDALFLTESASLERTSGGFTGGDVDDFKYMTNSYNSIFRGTELLSKSGVIAEEEGESSVEGGNGDFGGLVINSTDAYSDAHDGPAVRGERNKDAAAPAGGDVRAGLKGTGSAVSFGLAVSVDGVPAPLNTSVDARSETGLHKGFGFAGARAGLGTTRTTTIAAKKKPAETHISRPVFQMSQSKVMHRIMEHVEHSRRVDSVVRNSLLASSTSHTLSTTAAAAPFPSASSTAVPTIAKTRGKTTSAALAFGNSVTMEWKQRKRRSRRNPPKPHPASDLWYDYHATVIQAFARGVAGRNYVKERRRRRHILRCMIRLQTAVRSFIYVRRKIKQRRALKLECLEIRREALKHYKAALRITQFIRDIVNQQRKRNDEPLLKSKLQRKRYRRRVHRDRSAEEGKGSDGVIIDLSSFSNMKGRDDLFNSPLSGGLGGGGSLLPSTAIDSLLSPTRGDGGVESIGDARGYGSYDDWLLGSFDSQRFRGHSADENILGTIGDGSGSASAGVSAGVGRVERRGGEGEVDARSGDLQATPLETSRTANTFETNESASLSRFGDFTAVGEDSIGGVDLGREELKVDEKGRILSFDMLMTRKFGATFGKIGEDDSLEELMSEGAESSEKEMSMITAVEESARVRAQFKSAAAFVKRMNHGKIKVDTLRTSRLIPLKETRSSTLYRKSPALSVKASLFLSPNNNPSFHALSSSAAAGIAVQKGSDPLVNGSPSGSVYAGDNGVLAQTDGGTLHSFSVSTTSAGPSPAHSRGTLSHVADFPPQPAGSRSSAMPVFPGYSVFPPATHANQRHQLKSPSLRKTFEQQELEERRQLERRQQMLMERDERSLLRNGGGSSTLIQSPLLCPCPAAPSSSSPQQAASVPRRLGLASQGRQEFESLLIKERLLAGSSNNSGSNLVSTAIVRSNGRERHSLLRKFHTNSASCTSTNYNSNNNNNNINSVSIGTQLQRAGMEASAVRVINANARDRAFDQQRNGVVAKQQRAAAAAAGALSRTESAHSSALSSAFGSRDDNDTSYAKGGSGTAGVSGEVMGSSSPYSSSSPSPLMARTNDVYMGPIPNLMTTSRRKEMARMSLARSRTIDEQSQIGGVVSVKTADTEFNRNLKEEADVRRMVRRYLC